MRILSILIILTFGLGCNSNNKAKDSKTKQEVAQAITNWIEEYALYPESYVPVSFSGYIESGMTDQFGKLICGSEQYVVKHTHKILDKDSISQSFSGYFLLDEKLLINIIETERSNIIAGTYPPKTEIWMDQFGRHLTSIDSSKIRTRNIHHRQRQIEHLKLSLESDIIDKAVKIFIKKEIQKLENE